MRKTFKVILIIVGCILLLLVIAALTLNSQWGQNIVRGKAETFLNSKLKTKVQIGYLGVGFPKDVVIRNILILDQASDTLMALESLRIDISMLALIHKQVNVQQLALTGVHSHIYRHRHDTDFNFSYIVHAFASDTPKEPAAPKDTTGTPWDIKVGKVKLEDININFDDYEGGTRLSAVLQSLKLKMKKTDIDKMSFHIGDLEVAGLNGYFIQDSSFLPEKPKEPTNTDFQLIADNIDLQKVGFRYDDRLGKLSFNTSVASLQLALNKFGLTDQVVDIKKLAISNTSFDLVMDKASSTVAITDSTTTATASSDWHVTGDKIELSGVNFKMDNKQVAHLAQGMDYAHLNLTDINILLDEATYQTDSISGKLRKLSANEQCGLVLKECRTIFSYNKQGATLSELYLETPGTVLHDHLEVHYTSIDSLKDQLRDMALDIDIRKSTVSMSDVLLFAPDLEKQDMFKKNRNAVFDIELVTKGMLSDMDIKRLFVSGLSHTEVLLSGKLSGLPEAEKLQYDLNIATCQSSRDDLSGFIPDSVTRSVRIPDLFTISGQVSGTIHDYIADVNLTSTDGVAAIKGELAMSPGKGKERYNMNISTADLNIGRILRQDSTLGKVSANIVAKGTGFDPQLMNASIDADVISAMAMGYRYHHISLYGNVAEKKGNIDLLSKDPNVQIQLTGKADFSSRYPAVIADLKIDSIDLRAMKLVSSELRASGTMHADFPELNPEYPRGEFHWWQPVITADGKRFYSDSLYVKSKPTADSGQNITADLGILTASIKGKTPLSMIAPIIKEHIDRHYTFAENKARLKGDFTATENVAIKPVAAKEAAIVPADYSLQIIADIVDKPMLRSLLPDLTSFDSIHLYSLLTPRILKLDVTMPNIVYSDITISQGLVTVRGTDSAFTYQITADEISQKGFTLWFPDIHGRLNQNTITTNISIKDEFGAERFALAANMQKAGDSQIIHLQPGLILDYTPWTVAQPNRIVLAQGGQYIDNFSISNNGQFIKAQSETPRINAPLKIDFSNFMLANITRAVSKSDTLLADGRLNGQVSIDQFKPTMQLAANLTIRDVSVMGDSLGNLALEVNNKQENAFDIKLNLAGKGNDIGLTGAYYLKEINGNNFKMDLQVKALAVHSFEILAQNQIRNSSGFLRGALNIQGTTKAPVITGELHTDNLTTNVSMLNANFKLPSEKMTFTKEGISFDGFTIIDDNNNKAEIDGTINTTNLDKMKLDLKVRAARWRAIHSTISDNKMFYGDLLLTTNLTVKGDPSAPDVEGSLKILKGTDLTIVNPERNPGIESRKGIVVFVNMKDTGRRNVLAPRKKEQQTNSPVKGTDLNVNITVDKEAKFSLVLDQASGDFLSVMGSANINAALTPSGGITLAGSYELNNGAYQLNYNFVKRKFRIADGSSITFAGDPVTGTNLNITAVYEAMVSPYDLVQRQVSDPTQLNYYKQRLPFDVNLYMKGQVLNPSLSFDIRLPENKPFKLTGAQLDLVQAKLNQVRTDTSELNKQVFAVLILNRFVSDDPFSSSGSGSASFVALQSVSTFLGEQLNRASDKFIKGVDFTVDLATTEDYTSGDLRQRTDLNLAASKQLLNDRLKLTLGNNFELDGPQTNNTNQSSYVPTNLAADYMLTADGKYTLRAYRKAYDVGVLQGFVTETGLNFIVSFDYNDFRKAFRNKVHKRNTKVEDPDKEETDDTKIDTKKSKNPKK